MGDCQLAAEEDPFGDRDVVGHALVCAATRRYSEGKEWTDRLPAAASKGGQPARNDLPCEDGCNLGGNWFVVAHL